MKAYKGFNKDMTCRGFQFEEGKTYEEPEAKLCNKGFHVCEAPIDCLAYYPPYSSVYHEVELDGVTEEHDGNDSKRAGTKISIGARLDIARICGLQFNYTKSKCVSDRTGGDSSALTGGRASILRGGT